MGEERPAPQYPIESVDRALRLLLMFKDGDGLRLSAVRDHLRVGQSTAHRLMAMLVYHGFARQDPISRVYLPGSALTEVGLAVVGRLDLRKVAQPHLELLAAESNETAHVGVLEGADVRFIGCVESDQSLRVSGRTGRVLPAHATSMGKAMLATLDRSTVDALYPMSTLGAVTSRTKRRRTALMAELEQVRACGYATNDQESEDGVCSVGVAVVHPVMGLAGGFSLAAPTARTSRRRLRELATLLQDHVRQIVYDLH